MRAEKEILRGESERLTRDSEFQPGLSQMSIPLTIAYRQIGSASAFCDRMDITFPACCRALEDDLVSNDAQSVRMLAKVLALLPIPDLQHEARIACTLQFYTVTESSSTQQTIPTSAAGGSLDSEGRVVSTKGRGDSQRKKPNDPNKDAPDGGDGVQCSERNKPWVPRSLDHEHIKALAENLKCVRKAKSGQELAFLKDRQESPMLFAEWLERLEGKWEDGWKEYWKKAEDHGQIFETTIVAAICRQYHAGECTFGIPPSWSAV
ncbi:uncharacterized protein A1O5_03551 [Cladophialophora psammophila CBS 110553]|uniref:Uncharacterized protein n=1 Tax=Cladophialophora psammophila CBS 110553 TaxID=1182543 RepID=W9XU29_9EURO|nr:uncharacterized protein A1O5_03551 [Cladophialophora psammophila CBS 110553]EXJ73789.1 hypothetical protein A1O5_03551 [Cladophialophora psammophila CBS 110553]